MFVRPSVGPFATSFKVVREYAKKNTSVYAIVFSLNLGFMLVLSIG